MVDALSVPALVGPDSLPTIPQALWPQGPGSPASLLLLHILDDGTLGEGQLVFSLGLVVKQSLDCTLQR